MHYPEMDDGYFSSVNTMEGVGDKIVYLVNYSVDGRPAYRVYVDDGFNLRTFDLDFGRDAQVGSISSFRAAGHHVFFTAEVGIKYSPSIRGLQPRITLFSSIESTFAVWIS